MTCTRARIFAVSAAIVAAGAGALFAGCKGNPTSAAMVEKHVTPPPSVTVLPVTSRVNPGNLDPLKDPAWVSSPWYNLIAPSNTDRTTPAVRAALLYDATNLYVAFISDTVPPPEAPIKDDVVSVYLDSTPQQDGKEMTRISVTSTGTLTCDWIRNSQVALPKPDGSPDWMNPFATFPHHGGVGLSAKVHHGTQNGAAVWAAVLTIPTRTLPAPLAEAPTAGSQWKINLLRSINTVDAGSGSEQLQANLSQVYVGAQPVSPYRMAKMLLAGDPEKR